MPVVGVFVQTQVGDDNGRIAKISDQIDDRELHDARRIVGGRTARVLGCRDAEENQPADAVGHGFARSLTQRIARVLKHTGHRRDGYRFADAFLDEQRQHQIGR